MTASTRRAALGTILAAPLASAPALAVPAASPDLLRLIAEHDLQRDEEFGPDGAAVEAVKAGGCLRAAVMGYPSRGWADVFAKAECLARLWPLGEAEEEVARAVAADFAHLDDMALGLAVEVMRMAEGRPCV